MEVVYSPWNKGATEIPGEGFGGNKFHHQRQDTRCAFIRESEFNHQSHRTWKYPGGSELWQICDSVCVCVCVCQKERKYWSSVINLISVDEIEI